MVVTEECPYCYGIGECSFCDEGQITHDAPVTCNFCKEEVCGCSVCQAFCNCKGYWDYYIVPYMKEQERLGPN